MARVSVLLAVVATLAGCAREGPEDPALAVPGAGISVIPSGAVGAVGASFDAPSATPSLGPAPKSKHGKPKAAPVEPIPPDPFEVPPEDPSAAPSIAPPGLPSPSSPKKPKPHSPSETTL